MDKDDNTNKQANQKLASINPKQSNKERKEKGWKKYGPMMKEAFNMNIQQKERKLDLEKQRNN